MADDIKKPGDLERQVKDGSILKDLIRIFRTNTVVKHHFQSTGNPQPQGVAKMFFKNAYSFRNSVIPGYSSYDRFARISDYCLTGETLIASPSSEGFIKMKDLIDSHSRGEENFVFAFDTKLNKVVCQKISNAWMTKEDEIWEVLLDDGTIIECTKEHPFMLRDGTYKEAQHLREDDALMVASRRDYRSYNLKNKNRYKAISCNGKTKQEHRIVAEYKNNQNQISKDYHVHHVDFNGSNNHPNNLVIMKAEDHLRYHVEILNGRRWAKEFEREKMSDFARKRWQEDGDLRKNFSSAREKREKTKGWKKCVRDLIQRNKTDKYGQYNKGRQDQKHFDNANSYDHITIEKIKDFWKPGITTKDIANHFNCSLSVINKRFKWAGYKNLFDFVSNEFSDNVKYVTPFRSDLKAQDIYSAFRSDLSLADVAKKLNVSTTPVLRVLKENGYKHWSDFKEKYDNHKVVSVTRTERIEKVYDITVPDYNNFAVLGKDDYFIFVHNCEMEVMSTLSNALNIVSDEVTQKNEKGKTLEITSENEKVKAILTELFEDVLKLSGKNLWKTVRNMLKYGDCFYLIDITEENGVINLIRMPANEVEREEGFDKDDPAAIRFRWTAKQNIEIPNAFVAHFRLEGNDLFHPYGTSFLEAARRPWRQLTLLEDAMMAYRISRAPERKVFFLDVGGIPQDAVEPTINKFNESIKKKHVIDQNGRIDLRNGSALSLDEDYIIAVRGNDTATRIETLPGGQNLGDIEDVEYIRSNLFAALGIPKAFLTFDQDIRSKQVLTQEDIRFARTVARIQEVLVSELIKIAMIHLYIKGFRGDDLVNFKIKMTNPSTVAELQKMELWRARMDLVMSAKEGVFDTTFIYKEFLQLTENQVENIRKGQIQDKIFQAKLIQLENSQGLMQGGGTELGMMGGGGAMGGSLGGMPGGDMGAMGGSQLGGAPPDMGAAPPPEAVPADSGVAGEAKGMKDLFRDPSGDTRKKERRGLAGTDVTGAGDLDDDPNDFAGIRRTISSPMGGRETVDLGIKDFKSLFESYKAEEPIKSVPPMGMSQEYLDKVFGETTSKNTKTLLKEANKDAQVNLHEKLGFDIFEKELQKIEADSEELLNEVYNRNK